MNAVPQVISVEDDHQLFELIQHTLESLPIQLHHAANGHEALAILDEVNADLMILDIMLPDMHGWNILKEVEKTDHNLKGVIVLTAQTAATHRVIAHLQEVTAYMNKPFRPDNLRAKVLEILGLPD